MTEYVLVPQNGDRVIYGALDADSDHQAGMTVLRALDGSSGLQVFFYKALEVAAQTYTDVVPSDELVGGWFELAPAEPLPGGRPGGGQQRGDALARRFALKRPDHTWAVVTRYVYLATPLDQPIDSDQLVIEVHYEFLVCKDLHDVQGTEIFAYETYTALPYRPTSDTVRQEAFMFFSSDILWDGQEFDAADNNELVQP